MTVSPQTPEGVGSLVGRTPLVHLEVDDIPTGVSLWAKLEGFNPGGSVKDRPAWWMLREGMRSGALAPGKTIIDSTSGNTGIALAMFGAALGYPVELVLPANCSEERKHIVRAYGAQIIESDPLEGSDGAILACRERYAAAPERYFKPDQYFNPANPLAHFESTGPEIWEQTQGRVTHFLAGIGTGGTIMGTGRYLKKRNPGIGIVAVEPDDAFHGIEGLKHMASSIVPGIYHEEELDRKMPVGTDDAYDYSVRLARDHGLLVGQSSGAAFAAALRLARELEEGVIVFILCDSGERYLSTRLFL